MRRKVEEFIRFEWQMVIQHMSIHFVQQEKLPLDSRKKKEPDTHTIMANNIFCKSTIKFAWNTIWVNNGINETFYNDIKNFSHTQHPFTLQQFRRGFDEQEEGVWLIWVVTKKSCENFLMRNNFCNEHRQQLILLIGWQ